MQKAPGSSLLKLRFMQKSQPEEPKPTNIAERLLDEETAWITQGFEDVHRSNDVVQIPSNKHLKIRWASRKSFNGANPFIERYMQTVRKRH